jgi:hypothetical protein
VKWKEITKANNACRAFRMADSLPRLISSHDGPNPDVIALPAASNIKMPPSKVRKDAISKACENKVSNAFWSPRAVELPFAKHAADGGMQLTNPQQPSPPPTS